MTDKSMLEEGHFHPNSTFYALPAVETAEAWSERTPPGFLFNVKAYAKTNDRARGVKDVILAE